MPRPTRAASPTATASLRTAPGALPGGCTRDLVHRFYQEQYQLDGGQQDRYVTGSDSAGMTMGYYDTTQLPIYKYLHGNGAPNYVIADQFFQAAFGGSFLNHQYLIAARRPPSPARARVGTHCSRSTRQRHSRTDDLSALRRRERDASTATSPRPAACPTTVAGLACGDWAVNTLQPLYQPPSSFGAKMPAIDDTTTPH